MIALGRPHVRDRSPLWNDESDGKLDVCIKCYRHILLLYVTVYFAYVSRCSDTYDPGVTHYIQYIPRNMHTVFVLLCFVVVIHWLIFPYPSGLLHWHCGNLTIAPVPAKQPWWIWINTSCEFIMNDCITTTKQGTTKPCAYFLGYTVYVSGCPIVTIFNKNCSKWSEICRI